MSWLTVAFESPELCLAISVACFIHKQMSKDSQVTCRRLPTSIHYVNKISLSDFPYFWPSHVFSSYGGFRPGSWIPSTCKCIIQKMVLCLGELISTPKMVQYCDYIWEETDFEHLEPLHFLLCGNANIAVEIYIRCNF